MALRIWRMQRMLQRKRSMGYSHGEQAEGGEMWEGGKQPASHDHRGPEIPHPALQTRKPGRLASSSPNSRPENQRT